MEGNRSYGAERGQAYEAMIRYLARFHLPRFDQVGVLLGELEFSADGQTGDPAAWFDWIQCAEEVVQEAQRMSDADNSS